MDLPIDLSSITSVLYQVQADILEPIITNVYIDSSVKRPISDAIVSYLSSFNSNCVNVCKIEDKNLHLNTDPNFCVIVSGISDKTAYIYQALQYYDINVCVISVAPEKLIYSANNHGIKINKSDLVSPEKYFTSASEQLSQIQSVSKTLIAKFSNWLYHNSDNKIAYALHYPSLREKVAYYIVNKNALQNACIGSIGHLSGKDFPLMTLNQVKMVLEIAAIYDNDINQQRIPEIIFVTIYAFIMRYFSRNIDKTNFIKKTLVDAGFGFAGTELLGKLAINHFSGGGLIEDFYNKIKDSISNSLNS